VTIEREFPPLMLFVDDRHMHQVLVNVMSNAYQAITEGGSINIKATRNDGEVSISVDDSGAGFDSAALQRAFEPFFTTKVTGTGLGLAITKRLIEANFGTVSVENRPGGGARVQLRLPAVTPRDRTSDAEAPIGLGPQAGYHP
jgi:two-component system, NtrC family, sensor histidine kinase HydH